MDSDADSSCLSRGGGGGSNAFDHALRVVFSEYRTIIPKISIISFVLGILATIASFMILSPSLIATFCSSRSGGDDAAGGGVSSSFLHHDTVPLWIPALGMYLLTSVVFYHL